MSKIQLPNKPFLSKNLVFQVISNPESLEALTNAQLCDCIEVLGNIKLSVQEKKQSKLALLQMLSAVVN